jgi:hypothetical protein
MAMYVNPTLRPTLGGAPATAAGLPQVPMRAVGKHRADRPLSPRLGSEEASPDRIVHLTVAVPETLRRAAGEKAEQLGYTTEEVVRMVLRMWVDDSLAARALSMFRRPDADAS